MTRTNNEVVSKNWLYNWLFCGLTLLVGMVLLGGATRLYHAGLSIIEWELFKGVLPPLNLERWQEYFNCYRQSPEFKQFHHWMTLADFKKIFWFEYTHRLLGRIIGLWFLVPTLILNCFSWLPITVKKNLMGINALIIFQGYIGWYMVKSGLGKSAMVSHYRLALHLGIALMIISWVVRLLVQQKASCVVANKIPLYLLCIFFGLTVLYGVFVAGLKAGLIYNTFPLMGDHFLPSEGWFYNPLLLNFVKNPALIQFVHRVLGLTTVMVAWGVFVYYKRVSFSPFLMIAFLLTLQASLGIMCLLSQVSFWVAFTHQAIALTIWILLSAALITIKSTTFLLK